MTYDQTGLGFEAFLRNLELSVAALLVSVKHQLQHAFVFECHPTWFPARFEAGPNDRLLLKWISGEASCLLEQI